MRRIATATCIIGALALFGALIGQGVALAKGHHHHGHHARAHHQAKAKRSHARSHVERLAPVTSAGTGTTGTTGTTGQTGPGEESAGKVLLFEKGVLTLTLNDGSTVKGNVTSETRIKCESPAGTAKMADFGGQGGREDGSDDDDQGMGGMQESCGPSLLVPGAMVGEALLNIAPAGNTFIAIELLVPPSTTTEKSNFGDDEFGRGGGFGGEGGQ